MKFGAIYTCPVKGGLPDPANGKGAVAEIGKVKIRAVRYAVECYIFKIGLTKKIMGKTEAYRLVVNLLRDDRLCSGLQTAEVDLFPGGGGAGKGPCYEGALGLKVADLPLNSGDSPSPGIAAFSPYLAEQIVNRALRPTLQNIVDRADVRGHLRKRVIGRVMVGEEICDFPADFFRTSCCFVVGYKTASL